MSCVQGRGRIPTRVLTLAAFLSLFAVEIAKASLIVPLDPRATYLRTNNDPGSLDAAAIDLVALGILPGDLIFLEQLGDYSFDVLGPPVRPDEVTNMVGIFSSSGTLLSSDNQNRVTGALATVGYIPLVDWTTDPTFDGGLSTDISEDFYIGPAAVYVPLGASYLFVSAADSRFYDNGDPDADYSLRITKIGMTSVPEASSLVLGGVGAAAALGVWRRRQRLMS